MRAKVLTEYKKGVVKELFSEIVVFLVKKGSYMTFNTVKIRRIWEKKGKIRRTWWMTKKVIRIFGRENGNFFENNVIQKSWAAKNVFVPQTRRQVSATDDSYADTHTSLSSLVSVTC